MPQGSELNWANLIRVDSGWVERYLINHGRNLAGKVEAKVYSLRFASTEENVVSLIKFMALSIPEFVFSNDQINELIRRDGVPWSPWIESIRYFGDANPQKDGKCGEFLLYLLVEAVLKIPMVAHKIKSISDEFQDQVKGSDGVFFGNYKGRNSLLLGESKIRQDRGNAIESALESINEFHDSANLGRAIINELFAIRETRTANMKPEQLQYLLNVIDIGSEEYQTTNKVHPVLIVYNEKEIGKIEDACVDSKNGNKLAFERFKKLSEELLADVLTRIEIKWPNLKKVYLDFFFIPTKNVDLLRDSFYNAIHSTTYKKLEKDERERIIKEAKTSKKE
jgi:hypothetical protein